MMRRIDFQAIVFDVMCILAMVFIGTRSHDTDRGISGVAIVSVPFLIGLTVAYVMFFRASQDARAKVACMTTVSMTVIIGMLTRNIFFDRGTAPAFIIVASVFLSASMYGWRALSRRQS